MASKSNLQNSLKSNSNTKLIIIVLIVFFVLTILLVGGIFVVYRIAKVANEAEKQSSSQTTTETKTGWGTYKNSRFNFSVDYPKEYTKEESVNGDGATFVLASPKIELRSFAVLSAGSTADQYLAGILDLAQESMPIRKVSEIGSSSQNLGDIPGTMKIWLYDYQSKKDVEIRLAAASGENMYNLSLTCNYAIYNEYLPMFKEIATTFKH